MSDAVEYSQLRVVFHGRVQGVGFRYTVNRIARNYPVTGYVRNLADGTVELVISGSDQDVRATVADVSRTFAENITLTEEAADSSETSFVDFRIRR
jgi:acylphosphatase